MKLHSFSNRGSGVCRSLFLRTFMVMMLFITGSNGIYAGEDLPATIETPASKGSWDASTGTYKWTLGYDNLMPIFKITKGTLKTDYVALKFTTSNYTSQYRVCFMNDGVTVATKIFDSAGENTIKLSELGDLSQVDNIKFGGYTGSGSITLDPKSIVLVGQSNITVSPNDATKGTVYFTVGNDATQHTNTKVPNHTKVKFYANPTNEKVVFTGWGGDGNGKYYNSPTEVEVTKDLNFIANFVDGIHIKCTVEPIGAAEPDVYQKDHPTWKLPSDGYVAPGQATTFGFKNQHGKYEFLGWYDANNKQLSTATSYTVDNINLETKVIAKFSLGIQNNTQRYDFSNFKLTDQGSNVQSAVYQEIKISESETVKALVVKTQNQTDNYFPLYKNLNVTNSTGVRLHAMGVKFRILAKTLDNKTFQVNVPESKSFDTKHYKWEDFVIPYSDDKMTKADVAKITQIGLAGDNAAGETDKEFCVQWFWLDDIADYDKTIPCYGDEGGKWDWVKNSFVYTTAGATAVFEESTDRDANHNIILKANKKVTLSSDVNKFTEVCLVFGAQTQYDFKVAGVQYSGKGTAVIFPVNSSELTILNNDSKDIYLSKIIYSSEKAGINEERTITVDGKTRKYWLYVPASVKGENVPVVFSLHGRYNNDNPNEVGKPVFTSLAKEKGFIVVYPQGRNGGSDQDKKDYPGDWHYAFGGGTGWEATGKENADTKFIKALVDKIQSDYKTPTASNSNISVDPKKFYLCGFSMGGMMTYACAKVLNGTFAAYGSCGGFPLNEFHMNLATENPIPFIHLHGKNDGMLGIKHLNTIIENLLFRNGCDLSTQVIKKDWSTTKENGEMHNFKRYDFTSEDGAPVTTVTFDGLNHEVEASAPAYLWNFFDGKTTDMYKSDIEWKWDMPTINKSIADSENGSNVNAYTYGWKHVINGSDWSLTYGGDKNIACTVTGCTSAKTGCDGKHNVYNSIQLTAGKHTLYAETTVKQGWASVTLKNNLTGAEVVARKMINNTGATGATMNMLYEFEVGEGAEYSLILKRSDTNSACNILEIHKGSYRPAGKKDQSQDNATTDITSGKLAELTFEGGETGVDISPLTSGNGADLTSSDGNMKLYLKSRLGVKVENGKIVDKDKAKYIVKDPIFGHYFQNIPDADIYDRYGANDFLRVVLGDKNSLKGVQETGQITIGFWVNGDIAVNRGLAYDEPSMFYISGDKYYGSNRTDNPHMFNITCNGGLDSYMVKGTEKDSIVYKFKSSGDAFGDLCDLSNKASYYNNNFYKDCNWHYITYQMYDGLKRYNMYVDGNPTKLGGYAIPENNVNPMEYVADLKSIVLGGANATNVKYAYDVAFAYDDIVIYNRVLSKREINEIIKNKNYTPSVWQFNANIGSNIFFSPEKLDDSMWTNIGDTIYTLKTDFETSASLTYDGIEEIPAFRGLNFVTNGANKISIYAKNGVLKLSTGVKMIFSNMKKDNYVRMEYNHQVSDIWKNYVNQNMNQIVGIPSVNEGYDRAGFKITDAGDGKENSITMPSEIKISAIEATDKYFAQIKFVNRKNTSEEISVVENPKDTLALPRMDLYVNSVERLHKTDPEKNHKFKYSSSSPHVASVDSITGKVKLHGVSGSTVITAELDNSERKYDCDIYDEYTFEPSHRIFASYEIVVSPKANASKVIEDKSYSVGETIYNNEGTIGVTLGGWTYNNANYYEKTDSYSGKEMWAGQKFEKNPNRVGYKSDSRKTEENVFAEIFPTEGKQTFSTNGSHPAKSEQLKVEGDNTYAATGNYSAPKNNKSVANATPWLLPCRGSHIKIEPTDAGLISVYVMQEGCVSHAPSGGEEVGGVHYDADEPIDVTVKKVYVADEKGEIVKEVVADTKSKVAAQMWKDDGRARAEYVWGDSELAYNEATKTSFLKINDFDTQWSFLDNWPNPGMQQHVFKLKTDEDGHVLITKGIVRYTFNVLPGKTYYIFSNTAKLGLAGFTFESGKHAKYHKVKPDAKHDEWRATGKFEDYDLTVKKVTLNDGENYTAHTEKNAEVTLNRKFYRNYWNAICLPYSINRRQIEKVFGDRTMVVLMNNINTSTKKVMFIEHANQDIIAGYPYLIFPTRKDDTNKTDHSVINNGIITTRATFGEANSPLFSVGTDGKTYTPGNMQQNALVFKGTFSKEDLPVGSYVITKSGTLANVPQTGLTINPYRAYIHFNKTTPEAKAIKLASMGFAGFDDMEGETTSIEDLLFNDGIMTRPADVFTVNGQKVRSKAENLYGLPKGVYIVNGKKYVNK